MAGRRGYVTVEIEHLTTDTGLWCRPCALSTAARVWFTVRTGPRVVLRSEAFCTDCRSRDVQDA